MRDDTDAAILFIETSGCLPMCGHGTIGTVTVLVEEGLVTPKHEGRLVLEVPAGILEAAYRRGKHRHIIPVRMPHIPSLLHRTGLHLGGSSLRPPTLDAC